MQWLQKRGKYSGNEKMETKHKNADGPRIMRSLTTSIDVAIKLVATNTDHNAWNDITTYTYLLAYSMEQSPS
jgi:hypothetical protein